MRLYIVRVVMSLGLEVIDFQSNVVLKELSFYIKQLREVKKDDIPEHPILDDLHKCIKAHFKVSINFDFMHEFVGPAISLPDLVKNNVINEYWNRILSKNEIGTELIEKDFVKGTVNLRTGVVTGVFCNYPAKMLFPIEHLLNKNFTDEEHAATMLHEVGHLFIYFEMMSRTVTTNQLLASITRDVRNCNSADEREMIFHKIKTKHKLKDLDEKELSKSTNRKVIEYVVVSNVIKEMRSELGGNIYEVGTAEAMADQFACRFGAAVHLATDLEKMYRHYNHIDFRNPFEYFAVEVLKILVTFIPIVGWWLYAIMVTCDSSEEPMYDKPGIRLRRLREQLVMKTKSKKIDKEELKSILDGISVIDNILKDVYDNIQLTGMIAYMIFPSRRALASQKEFQRKLEEIAINDIFLKSAELRTLGDK